MDHEVELISEKIRCLEKEHLQSRDRARDYEVKAAECRAKASELEVVLKHLRAWAADLGIQVVPKLMANEAVAVKPPPIGVRAIVKDILPSIPRFTTQELIRMVRERAEGANPKTIAAELTYRKRDGDITQLAPNVYLSNLYRGPQDSVIAGYNGGNNEPGPDFGQFN